MSGWDVPAGAASVDGGVLLVLAGVAALLLLTTLWRAVRTLARPDDTTVRERLHSAATWWGLLVAFAGILLVGRGAVAVAMAVAFLLLLRETVRLVGPDPGPWRRAAAVLLAATGPACTAAVAWLPPHPSGPDAPLGWLVLLAVLTELNDSAQAWWGRSIGRHRVAPRLSPRKTWEGLAGGVLTTTVVSAVVAPLLTPYGAVVPLDGAAPGPTWIWSAGIGLLLALGGGAGDLLASAWKRRAGVKDSGRMLPGHGGILDRMDSLTVTAPLFYLVSRLLWFAGG